MDAQPGAAVWAVLGVPLLVLLAGAVARPVLPGELVHVVRRDVVRRSGHRGVTLRVPLLDRFVVVDAAPTQLLTSVRARTGDGHEVLVLLEATWQPVACPPGTPYLPPASAVDDALAAAVRDSAAWLGVEELPDGLGVHLDALAAAVRVPGVVLLDVELVEVDVLLRPASAPGVRTAAGTDGSG
ncbi:hypothetical protein [Nocardioides pantholopis]|uniref:hypothetical protein n=1 Tax=Nocardioides pantholopis TaxID=2483798 RepID=UPI000F08B024|nr:hypothetical protein [Nocardioides pantholopis]